MTPSTWTDNAGPFAWTKTADEIFNRINAYLARSERPRPEVVAERIVAMPPSRGGKEGEVLRPGWRVSSTPTTRTGWRARALEGVPGVVLFRLTEGETRDRSRNPAASA